MECNLRRDKPVKILVICATILLALAALGLALFITLRGSPHPLEKAEQILASAPLIDGNNDFLSKVRLYAQNNLRSFNFSKNLTQFENWTRIRTDIPRLRAGKVGAQIWSASAECVTSQHKDAVVITLEQIDVIKRLVANYSRDFKLVKEAKEIMAAVEKGRIASLIAVDGGHSMQYSLGVLRAYYDLGVRIMTLAGECSNPWAQSYIYNMEAGNKSQSPEGLTDFGKKVISEMNRLGMMIDISHSSKTTMRDAILTSHAPVIVTRTAAKTICSKEINIPDDILEEIKQRQGLVMVNFYPDVIKCGGGSKTTIDDVIKHLDHLRQKTSIDNIGIGSNFDGFTLMIEGLEDVSKFPNLFAELVKTNRWSDDDLTKLAGRNFLRVFKAVEKIRDDQKGNEPVQIWMKRKELKKYANLTCSGTSLKD